MFLCRSVLSWLWTGFWSQTLAQRCKFSLLLTLSVTWWWLRESKLGQATSQRENAAPSQDTVPETNSLHAFIPPSFPSFISPLRFSPSFNWLFLISFYFFYSISFHFLSLDTPHSLLLLNFLHSFLPSLPSFCHASFSSSIFPPPSLSSLAIFLLVQYITDILQLPQSHLFIRAEQPITFNISIIYLIRVRCNRNNICCKIHIIIFGPFIIIAFHLILCAPSAEDFDLKFSVTKNYHRLLTFYM